MNDNKSCNELSLRKDSFSDRFCDDLCEVVVSYLSFEDKILFECVSHQFQRLIFNKQYVLQVFDFPRLETQNSLNLLLKGREIDLKAFERVLKKCKFINKIVIDSYYGIECENREKVLQLIAKYVKHLKSIEFYFHRINEKVFLEFGEKCGQKLQNINFNYFSDYDYKPFLKLCPNIRSLTNIRLSDMIENNDLLVPKLMSVKELEINSDNILFKTFVNKTQNSLKCLGIRTENYSHEDSSLKLFQMISNYMNLEELHLNCIFLDLEQYKALNSVLHCIGFKCKTIKRLSLLINEAVLHVNKNIEYESINCLTNFPQLKHLSLNFWPFLDIKSLQNCKQLTHLRLDLKYAMLSEAEDEDNSYQKPSFNDIDLYLPQLTYFNVCVDWDITDDEVKPLSKLKHLKYLIIIRRDMYNSSMFRPLSLTDEGICEIINNCPEMISIIFKTKPKITHKTINALISLAEKKPFCNFVYSFGEKPYNSERVWGEGFDYIEFISNIKYEILPKNLIITPYECKFFYLFDN